MPGAMPGPVPRGGYVAVAEHLLQQLRGVVPNPDWGLQDRGSKRTCLLTLNQKSELSMWGKPSQEKEMRAEALRGF